MEIELLTQSYVKTLSRAELLSLGKLIYEAAPEYYQCFGIDAELLYENLTLQVGAGNTELSQVYAAKVEGSIAGFVSCVETSLLIQSQMNGSMALYRLVGKSDRPSIKSKLSSYSSMIEEITIFEGIYLPRLTVSAAFRGQGIARQ